MDLRWTFLWQKYGFFKNAQNWPWSTSLITFDNNFDISVTYHYLLLPTVHFLHTLLVFQIWLKTTPFSKLFIVFLKFLLRDGEYQKLKYFAYTAQSSQLWYPCLLLLPTTAYSSFLPTLLVSKHHCKPLKFSSWLWCYLKILA